ncbi:MAG TPA: outer membrane beta-barrel protein [Bacteroidota bacterium]|nr:outer membrane beta-barrel protein [Bacteroidota bacterium]
MRKLTLNSIQILVMMMCTSVAFGQMRTGKLGIGFRGDAYLFQSDHKDEKVNPGGGLDISYSFTENVGLRIAAGIAQLKYKDNLTAVAYTTTIGYGNIYLSGDFMPNSSINPFIFAGGGGIYYDPRRDSDGAANGKAGMKPSFSGGAGFDIFFNEFISVTIAGEYVLGNTDKLDGYEAKTDDDMYQRVSISFRYYFFDQDFITKMLKALEERYKK